MSVITLALEDELVTGKMITFKAPCDCTGVTALSIDGTEYSLVDACGNAIGGYGNIFTIGSMVSVVIDLENSKACLLNGNAAPAQIGAAPAYTYGTEDLTAGTSPLETGKLYFVYEES